MLTEFEVRRRMEAILKSRLAPHRKARLLLRIDRKMHRQLDYLRTTKAQLARHSDPNSVAGMARMASRSLIIREELRAAAYEALTTA